MKKNLAALTVILGLAVVSFTATQAAAQVLITPEDPGSGGGGGPGSPPDTYIGGGPGSAQTQGQPPAHANGWGRGGKRISMKDTSPVEATTLSTAGLIKLTWWDGFTLLDLYKLRFGFLSP